MRCLLTLLATSLLVGWCGPPLMGAERYALLVGVNDCPQYELPGGGKPRALAGAEYDAKALGELLIGQCGFAKERVVLVLGEKATHQGIREAFEQMARRVKKEDIFVFHYSGHGTQVDDVAPFDEADRLDEALCPSDAQSTGKNLLRDDELALLLEAIPAHRITAILDCCHAGTGTKDPGDEIVPRYLPSPGKPAPTEKPKEPWRELRSSEKGLDRQQVSFFACQPNQQAYERRLLPTPEPRRVGQFSYYLREGLRGSADSNRDKSVTNGELLDYVRQRLDQTFNAPRGMAQDRQMPVSETSDPNGVFLPH